MKNRSTALIIVLFLLVMTPDSAPARPAEEPKYDNNCLPYTPEEQEIKKENIILVVIAPATNAYCRGVEKFRKLVRKLVQKKDFDPDKIDADEVFEASKPDLTSNDSSFGTKVGSMPSPTKRPGWNPNPSTSIVVLPPNTAGGVPLLFQPNAPGGPIPSSVNQIEGNGTLISAEGMKRGTFKQGKLNGVGEEIDPDGTWRGGTYDSDVNVGYVVEVRTVGGKTYIADGSVLNGKLDGMIRRVYADGSTQFEDWENGQLMQVGNRAPKGGRPLAPQARYKPPVEVAYEDAYKKIGPRPKIAPGTTFDPARIISTAPSITASQCTGQNGLGGFDAEFNQFQSRYPLRQDGGMRDVYQYLMFDMSKALNILQKYKQCLNPDIYEQNRQAMQQQYDRGLNGCRQTSSDGEQIVS